MHAALVLVEFHKEGKEIQFLLAICKFQRREGCYRVDLMKDVEERVDVS